MDVFNLEKNVTKVITTLICQLLIPEPAEQLADISHAETVLLIPLSTKLVIQESTAEPTVPSRDVETVLSTLRLERPVIHQIKALSAAQIVPVFLAVVTASLILGKYVTSVQELMITASATAPISVEMELSNLATSLVIMDSVLLMETATQDQMLAEATVLSHGVVTELLTQLTVSNVTTEDATVILLPTAAVLTAREPTVVMVLLMTVNNATIIITSIMMDAHAAVSIVETVSLIKERNVMTDPQMTMLTQIVAVPLAISIIVETELLISMRNATIVLPEILTVPPIALDHFAVMGSLNPTWEKNVITEMTTLTPLLMAALLSVLLTDVVK
jgi:hypothetical protein